MPASGYPHEANPLSGIMNTESLSYEELLARCERADLALQSLLRSALEVDPHVDPAHSGIPEDASRRILASMLENIPGVVYRCHNDPEWTMVYMSHGVSSLTGYPLEDLIGNKKLSYGSLIRKEDRPYVWSEIQQKTEQNLPYEIQYRIITSDGVEKTVWERGRGALESHGKQLFLEGYITDVSSLSRTEHSLREIEGKYRALVDHSQSIIYSISADGKLTFASPSWKTQLGYFPDEMLGRDYHSFVHPDDISICEKYLALTIETGQPQPANEIRVMGKDGNYRWFRNVITPVYDADGQLQLLVGNGVDIHGHKQALAMRDRMVTELHKQKEAAESASRAKDEFLAVMSHEMRTPLNPILGFANLILDDGVPDENHRKFLHAIVDAAESQLKLIDHILGYTRLDRGSLQPVLTRFKLLHTCQCAIEDISPMAHGLHISLQNGITDLQPVPPDLEVRGEHSMLNQILGNLLGNATKYTREGSICLRVGLSRSSANHALVRFEVEDTGIGISPEHISKLFHPFSQVDASFSRDYGGVGLGLAICRKLVETLDGQIGVESKPGKGSLFWFCLPLGIPDQDSHNGSSAAASESSLRLSRSLHLLVVDDRPDNAIVVSSLAGKMGASCDLASSGMEALDHLRNDSYDAILLDLAMPGMSGFEVIRTLRSSPGPNRKTPVIAVTADVTANIRETCRNAGMMDYLSKPVRKDFLFNILRSIADTRHPPA